MNAALVVYAGALVIMLNCCAALFGAVQQGNGQHVAAVSALCAVTLFMGYYGVCGIVEMMCRPEVGPDKEEQEGKDAGRAEE